MISSWNLDIVKAHQLWQGFQSMSGSKIGDCLNGNIGIRDTKRVTFIRAYLKKRKKIWLKWGANKKVRCFESFLFLGLKSAWIEIPYIGTL